MITNKGKEIISKFLLGQTPSYGSHIAIGCGAVPLDSNDPAPSASALAGKEKLDFEMARVPIVSKGFVDDNGTNKISLTAELPKENRYNITEIGLWSSGSNTLAKGFDSKVIFNFSEAWQAHNVNISALTTPDPLGSGENIITTLKYFRASTNNTVFSSTDRKARKEGPRFLNSKIFLRGDSSIIQGSSGSWTGDNPSYSVTNKVSASGVATLTLSSNPLLNVGDIITVNIGDIDLDGDQTITARTSNTVSFSSSATVSSASTSGTIVFPYSTHIHLNGINFDISQNAPSDILSFAFSLIDKDGTGAGVQPDQVKILIEFYRNEDSLTAGFAKKEISITGSEFAGNRYKVVEFPISDLITSADFSSTQIRVCRIFASVIHTDGGIQKTSPEHYIELEGFRVENITTENPVYGLVGYSVVRTDDGQPIYKYDNTTNYIEFRFNLDVG